MHPREMRLTYDRERLVRISRKKPLTLLASNNSCAWGPRVRRG